jgi:hypothetical protein
MAVECAGSAWSAIGASMKPRTSAATNDKTVDRILLQLHQPFAHREQRSGLLFHAIKHCGWRQPDVLDGTMDLSEILGTEVGEQREIVDRTPIA